MAWDPDDPIERQKRIAWDIATSCSIQTREDPVMIYNRLMKENKNKSKSNENQLYEKT